MRTETIATRNLKEFMERNNTVPSREDIINILAMLPLFIKPSFDEIELVSEELETTNKNIKKNIKKNNKTNNIKTNNIKNNNSKNNNSKNNNDTNSTSSTPKDILNEVRNLQEKLGKTPTMQQLKENNIDVKTLISTYGNWRAIKNSLNNMDSTNELIELTKKLNRIPTMKDVKDNSINIDDLLLKYGSWKNIKKELKLAEVYENILKEELLNLKTTSKLTFNNCKNNNIDVNYLMRKFGGWKEALKALGV